MASSLAVMAGAAGVIMGVAPLLQAARVLRRRHADDVSAGWLAVIVGGTAVWTAYGLRIENWAIIVPNVAGCLAAALTLAVVLTFRRRARPADR